MPSWGPSKENRCSASPVSHITICACAAARSLRIPQTYVSLAAPLGGLRKGRRPARPACRTTRLLCGNPRADAPHRAAISSAASRSPGRLPGPHARPRQSTEGAGAMITPESAWDACPAGAHTGPRRHHWIGAREESGRPAPTITKHEEPGAGSFLNRKGTRNSPASLPHNEVRFSGGAMPQDLTILRFHSATARRPGVGPRGVQRLARTMETLVIWRNALSATCGAGAKIPGPPHGDRGAGTC